MRIFIALDIPDDIRERIARFEQGVSGFAPDAKWVNAESFHITLKFIGEQKPDEVENLKQVLQGVRATPFQVSFGGYGFFPNPRSARVFWAGINAGPELERLTSDVDDATAQLGIPRERNKFTPHLTLARARDDRSPRGASGRPHGGGGRGFGSLPEKLQSIVQPEFGTMTPTEFFLYESKLSPKGAQYTKLARFPFVTEPGEQTKNE
jgi:2'-5' RNA ligase